MKVLPNSLKSRSEINYRHGIKSSLSELTKLIGLVISLYEINAQKPVLEYCSKDSTGRIFIQHSSLEALKNFFQKQIENSVNGDFEGFVNANPLFNAQIEPLQVVLELFFKLGKISFKAGYPSSKERTGGERFEKIIQFSTYMDLLKTGISDESGKYSEGTKNLLFNWITNKNLPVSSNILSKIRTLLTIFSEDTQYKLRHEDDKEIYFQGIGIYSEIEKGNEVISNDSHELVGPFRILKSFLRSNLHPYLTDQDNVFTKNTTISNEEFADYASKVAVALELTSSPKVVFTEVQLDKTKQLQSSKSKFSPHQTIYYGCPGTGKSTTIKDEVTKDINDQYIFRTTFHPEYDYANFVGSYKPTMVQHANEATPSVSYAFVPQVFTKAYVSALKNPDDAHCLVIEEINRGNCALIFGDIFQLLDRKDGISEYEIHPDADLQQYLTAELGENTEGVRLPANLSILATMNTSDQSLFPMDSAFKRRWDWVFVPIDYSKAAEFEVKIGEKTYNWGNILQKINRAVSEITESEDKQLGTFFVKPEGNVISETQFVNKVMYYLWSDIFKNNDKKSEFYIFKYRNEANSDSDFTYNDLHSAQKQAILEGFFKRLDVEPN